MVRDAPRDPRAARELKRREARLGENRAREPHGAWRRQRALSACRLRWRVAKQIDASLAKQRAPQRAFRLKRP